jgi:hypothetical protein
LRIYGISKSCREVCGDDDYAEHVVATNIPKTL